MYAVRDGSDRNLVELALRPQAVPHLARDFAVERGDAVRIRRRPEREGRQPEASVVLLRLAERRELGPAEAAASHELLDVPFDESRVEHLISGRHGRVRREDRRGAQLLQRRIAWELPVLDELAHALELQERRVALVQVEHRRVDAEPPQRAHAPDPENELLPQAVTAVAAVEPVGDRPRPIRVAVDVAVEQVERDPADLRPPDLGAHGNEGARVVGELDHRRDRLERQRQSLRVVVRIALRLPVVRIELLPEVALAIEEPHRHQWDAEIRRGFQVIARKHSEAARVDGEALVEPELAREVRDPEALVLLAALPPGPPRALVVELA